MGSNESIDAVQETNDLEKNFSEQESGVLQDLLEKMPGLKNLILSFLAVTGMAMTPDASFAAGPVQPESAQSGERVNFLYEKVQRWTNETGRSDVMIGEPGGGLDDGVRNRVGVYRKGPFKRFIGDMVVNMLFPGPDHEGAAERAFKRQLDDFIREHEVYFKINLMISPEARKVMKESGVYIYKNEVFFKNGTSADLYGEEGKENELVYLEVDSGILTITAREKGSKMLQVYKVINGVVSGEPLLEPDLAPDEK